MGGFNEKIAQVVVKLRGVNGYILEDFNADLIKVRTHAPTSEFLGAYIQGVLPPDVASLKDNRHNCDTD